MKKMKLQGTNSKKIPKEKKKKMNATLEDMTNVRNEDSARLRKIIQVQLTHLKDQHDKAIKVENTLMEQLKDIRRKELKIEGAILGLMTVLKIADGKEKKEDA